MRNREDHSRSFINLSSTSISEGESTQRSTENKKKIVLTSNRDRTKSFRKRLLEDKENTSYQSNAQKSERESFK